MRARRQDALAAALVGLVAFLPFLRGALCGASLYFRDLAVGFFPLRRLALDGLRSGEVSLWNPYVHEGVPLSLPAVGYLPDLLQLLRPDEVGISLSLALHVPLAALAFFALVRRLLALSSPAAAGGALVYALGGFVLSTVNLYVLLQAAAWAPLVVLALAEVVGGGKRRAIAIAAVVVAVAVSTTGVEIVVQAVLAGAILGFRRGSPVARLLRLAAALVLGAALVAPVLALLAAQVGASARGSGLAPEVVLAHSVHPFTFVQTVVGGLYGNLANLPGEWWGQNFFPRGFPYILSLYIGASAFSLGVVGARGRHALRTRLLVLVVVGVVVCLGRYAGWLPLVDAVPGLRVFRYPVKAFFTVHLAVSLLVALGLGELAGTDRRRAFSWLAAAAATLGSLLVALPLLPRLVPAASSAFGAAFFPPGLDAGARAALLGRVTTDAAVGGALALATAAVATLAQTGLVPPARATLFVLVLLAGDLLRTGAGLNPMVSGAFFRPSPPLARRLDALRERRVFTCPFDASPAYRESRRARGANHEIWTFAVALETLTPALNVSLRVPTAMSLDLTMLVPAERVLPALGPACRDLDALVPRLRDAGVDTVVSLDPLSHAELAPVDEWRPARIAPLAVHLYRLSASRPRVSVAPVGIEGARGTILEASFSSSAVQVEAEAGEPGVVVVRDGWAAGWTATVNGQPAPVQRVDGRHRGVAVPAGRSSVAMRYRPRLLPASLVVSLIALGTIVVLSRDRWRRRDGPRPAGAPDD